MGISAAARSLVETPQAKVSWLVALVASLAGPWLLSLAFPSASLELFAFIALVPLFLLWSKASWKEAFFWGWLSGTFMYLLLWYWMTHSVGDFVGSWSIVALVLLCAVEGLTVAIVAVLTSLVGRGEFRAASIFAIPAAWLLLEWWRTHGMLGVPFGELGLAVAHLSWLLPLAAFGGVYLLTVIIALVNAAIAGIIGGTLAARRTGVIVLAVVVVMLVGADRTWNRVVIDPPTIRVAIAQGNISQREKWTPAIFEQTLQIYSGLTRQAAASGAKVVVWPETVVTSYPLQQPDLLTRLESIASQSGVWIMTGTVDRPSADVYYNSMIALNPDNSLGGVYHKRFLVPFAEYLPLDRWLRPLPLLDSASRFVSGPGPTLLAADGLQWGTLICWESAFAPYARDTANAGADAIIVATDDAWFGTTGGPYQHADIAVVDAISTGRWIVRGADTGISEIIDPKGNIVARLGLDQQGVVVGDIGRGLVTPYDRYGFGWLLGLSLLAVIAGLVRSKVRPVGWRSRRGS